MEWVHLYIFFSGWLFVISLVLMLAGLVMQAKTVMAMTERIRNISFHRRSILGKEKTPMGRLKWSLPGRAPLLGAASIVFHFIIVFLPFFISGHWVLLNRVVGICFPVLTDSTADIATLWALAAGGILLARRFLSPSIRYLSTAGDYGTMAVTLGPFLTGYLAYHGIGDYEMMMALHALSGNLFLIALGWTRLGHFIFYFYGRFAVRGEFSLFGGMKRWRVGGGS